MNLKKIIKTTIIISIIVYLCGIIYTVVFRYVSIGDIIKASFIGFCVGIVNIVFEVWFKEDLKKYNEKIKEMIK